MSISTLGNVYFVSSSCRMCIKDVCSEKIFQMSFLFVINVRNFRKKNVVSFSNESKRKENIFNKCVFFFILERFLFILNMWSLFKVRIIFCQIFFSHIFCVVSLKKIRSKTDWSGLEKIFSQKKKMFMMIINTMKSHEIDNLQFNCHHFAAFHLNELLNLLNIIQNKSLRLWSFILRHINRYGK